MDIRKRRLKGYIALSILLIMCLVIASAMTFYAPNKNANAISNVASTLDIGDLMLSESKNGKIFDGDVLKKLYGLVTGNINATFDDVKSAGIKDSEFFRNTSLNSDKKDLIIKVGQFKWNIVYLSRTSDNENADVILTLLLTDSTQLPSGYQTAQFNTYAPNNPAGATHTKYPASMYGTSKIRAVTLNNGGEYANADSTLNADKAEQDLDNPFAQYTMATATNSLTNYIVTPGEVQWQRSEKANEANDFIYNLNNDAIDSISSGFANHNYQITPNATTVSQAQRTLDYTAWKDDKIWIPSVAEIGTGVAGNNNGIWNTNANQRGNGISGWSWLRSASQTTSTRSVVVITNDGVCAEGNNGTKNLLANGSYGVRPAFHLNLTKVAEKATVTSTERTGDTTQYKSYNDESDFTFKLDKIDAEVVKEVELTATNLDSDDKSKIGTPTTTKITTPTYASGGMSFKVNDVGKYTVKITLNDGQCWKDGSTTKTFDYYLKYKLTALAWNKNSSPDITETYNGEYQYLVLKNYNADIAKLLTLTPAPVKIKEVDGKMTEAADGTIYAIKVKDYAKDAKVTVSLKNTTYMVWDDADKTTASKELKYSIDKLKLTAEPVPIDNDTAWKMEVDTEKDEDRTFYLWVSGICKEEDLKEISFKGYKKKGGGAEEEISGAPEFVKDENDDYVKENGKYKLKIVFPKISADKAGDDYTYILKPTATSSSNYYLLSETTNKYEKGFSVNSKSVNIKDEDIVWQYKIGNGAFSDIGALENDVYVVTYNANGYTFRVDTTANGKLNKYNDYVTFEELTGTISGTNVEMVGSSEKEYTITFKITPKDGVQLENTDGEGIEYKTYTLKWKIKKALFDLSGVEWGYYTKEDYKGVYTEPIEYDGEYHKVQLRNLPKGLKVQTYADDYQNIINVKIDTATQKVIAYTAKVVAFNFDTSTLANADKNYELPKSGVANRSTYVYKEDGVDKEFPWILEWTIKKKTLTLDWIGEVYNDEENGMPYFSYKIETKSTEDKIDYVYYAYDDYDNENGVVKEGAKAVDKIIVDVESDPVKYWVVAKLRTTYEKNYEIDVETQAMEFKVGLIGSLIKIDMDKSFVYDGKAHGGKDDWTFPEEEYASGQEYIQAEYYSVETVDGKEVRTLLGRNAPTKAGKYTVNLSIVKAQEDKYMLNKVRITYEIKQAELTISLDGNKNEFTFNGKDLALNLKVSSDNKLDVSNVKIKKTYYVGDEIKEDGSNKLADGVLPRSVGKYIVVLSIDETDEDNYRNYKIKETCIQFDIEITPYQITAVWDTTGDIPTLKGLSEKDAEKIEYVYTDEDGITYKQSELEAGKIYNVKAVIKEDYEDNYVFVDKKGNVLDEPTMTDEQTFKMKEETKSDDPIVSTDPENPNDPENPTTNFDISKIGEMFKEWWQLIASVISIILMLIFITKTIGYEKERKKNLKAIDKKYNTFYAIALFGLTPMTWTLIACVLMGGALLTFVIMLMAKSKRNKSLEAMDEAKEEFERNQRDFDNRKRNDENQHRDEQLQMMLMGMLGGNANGQNGGGQSFVYQQPSLGADDIRGIVADTMNNMLPNVTQYLPQEASHNDELIQQLIEQNAQNEERIRQMNEQNEERMQRMMQQLAEQNNKSGINEDTIERLVEKLSTQQAYERQAEREVAAVNANDEIIKSLIEGQKAIMEKLAQQDAEKKAEAEKAEKQENAEIIKKLVEGQEMLMRKMSEKPAEGLPSSKVAEIDRNTDKIEMLVRNQERLMERVIEMSAKNSDKSNERLMEKMIELSVKADNRQTERVVEKPVEKIVEKEVRVEVPVEKIVEKEVVKEVPVPMTVEKPTKEAKAPAQRLTLDEAYAKLSANQKKIFDTLKAYAMSKDKCKEKKSTYFTVLGQSTVNPLVKLTIKKNTTVAMFKMEDEYFKDIRRGASSDGTKVKVKETEVVVGDNQALATAKDMIDLREDQIERYNDYLKEQKSMRRK